jgi:hypothetical protein
MSDSISIIDLNADLEGFFKGIVGDAVRRRENRASEAVELYVAALLADYARPGALENRVLDTPVVFLLREALESRGAERFERLRRLGDDVLYVSGFFGDHVARRGVEASFVMALGARAYDGAAAILRSGVKESAGPDVFTELAARFELMVSVLSDVSEKITARAARTPEDVLGLYGRWLEKGSPGLAEELARWGLVAPRAGRALVH